MPKPRPPSPPPASQAVYDAVARAIGKEAVFVDLGAHQLRGLTCEVQLWQVLPQSLPYREFPPLRLDQEQDETDYCCPGTADRVLRRSSAQFLTHPMARSQEVWSRVFGPPPEFC